MLNCALGGTAPGTNYGQLRVPGTVALNGLLSVDLVNGFLPAPTDSFTVLTAGTRTGAFANFLFRSDLVTMQLDNTSNSVVVLVVPGGLPERVLVPPQISGTNITLFWGAPPNVIYRVEVNSTLDPSAWTALPGDVTSSGGIACKADTLTPTNRFYRIRALP